jgi:cell division septation protein DedD
MMKWFNSKQAQSSSEPQDDSVRPPTKDMRSQLGIQTDAQPAVRIRANRSGAAPSGAMHAEAAAVYDEEVRLNDLKVRTRRRLIGAVVLLTAAFIILPWIFDEQRKQTASEVAVVVPDKNLQFDVKNPRATDESIRAAAENVAQTPNSNVAPPATNTTTSTTTAAINTTAGSSSTAPIPPTVKPPETITASTQKYAVHIGLVSNGKELDALLSKLRAAGVEPQLKTVVVDGVSKTRVRLGLFDTQAAAAAAAAKAKGAAKNPVVIPIKPNNN